MDTSHGYGKRDHQHHLNGRNIGTTRPQQDQGQYIIIIIITIIIIIIKRRSGINPIPPTVIDRD